MTEVEKSYIAGIIDGEGSIMLIKNNSNEHPSPCVSIASTSLELLTWIQKTYGKGTIKNKKNYRPHYHLDSYSYVIKGNAALDLLNQINSYLVINQKKQRSSLLINEYKSVTPRNGRYSNHTLRLKMDFINKFNAIK